MFHESRVELSRNSPVNSTFLKTFLNENSYIFMMSQCCFVTINVRFFTVLVFPPLEKEELFQWRLIEAHVFCLSLHTVLLKLEYMRFPWLFS